ncbi:glutathione peroxidase [Coprinopsis cinerea okayama7|uniref:Glutathione peroxidase n=1 Tax=Coprinopsis cinerea (strain Okayama-7 / 130 / ATCC MYA-4618 / FGSC 9003) TaxID=240176 RepID=A8NUA0_COPC7|nr:glutathione peroxidase [Coprinopsis cinerea okayama7\|eukprot:XP_001836408.2 glutathione peroxidase [Coprinopsis cinerea okayama7\
MSTESSSGFYSLKAELPNGQTYDFEQLRGKVVLIFGGQEPADDAGIQEFCTVNHGVTFPLMKKSEVNGDNTNEVYQWLKSKKAGFLGLTRIKWNFEKFLVDKEGNVVNRWASTTSPSSIASEIEKLLTEEPRL